MLRRTLLGLALALALAGPAAAEPWFLRQEQVTPQDRSRIIDSIDTVDGCGSTAQGGPIKVDGRADDWRGTPTMISGTGRYDDGEYLWTDYAFDDDGTGTYQYPGEGDALVAAPGTIGKGDALEQRYGSNAADVVELRAAEDPNYLYLLVRFNFLNAVDSTVVGLAFDLDHNPATGFAEWPYGARMQTPGTDLFLTAYGTCASVETADGAEHPLDALGGAIRVDTADNVFEIALPRSLLGGAQTPRIAGGAGLWDPKARDWMLPTVGTTRNGNTSSTPAGAAGANDPGVFNLLFRGDEGPTVSKSTRAFQTTKQHQTLSGGTSGPYGVDLDLGELADHVTDAMPVRRGTETAFTRIYRSRIDTEGVVVQKNYALFLGRYEPYGVYLPSCYEHGCSQWPDGHMAAIELVHGGGGSHVDSLPGSEGTTTTVDDAAAGAPGGVVNLNASYRALDSSFAPLVVTVLGRGQRPPWWRGYGEADALELRADAQRVYDPDPERWIITGGSLGGYGTIRLASMYPDLWTGAFAHCPAEFEDSISGRDVGNVDTDTQNFVIDPVMAGMLDVPFRMASGTADPLVPIVADHRLRDTALADGLDYHFTEFHGGSHCWDNAQPSGFADTPGSVSAWTAGLTPEYRDLASHDRAVNPARVRYVIDPRHFRAGPEPIGVFDIRDLGIDYDGAYWVSGLHLRPADEAAGVATPEYQPEGNYVNGPTADVAASIDVASHALGHRPTGATSCGSSTGLGGSMGGNPELAPSNPTPNSYQCQAQTFAPAEGNALDLTTRNLDAGTIDTARAGIDPDQPLRIAAQGDGPFQLALDGYHAAQATGPCVAGSAASGSATTLTLQLTTQTCTVELQP